MRLDLVFGRPHNKKRLLYIDVDFRKDTASAMSVGYSEDSGATWTDSTVDMSGTGRGTERLYVDGGPAQEFRFRVSNTTADHEARILGITPWVLPKPRRD